MTSLFSDPATGDPVLLRLLSLARAHLGMEVAFLSTFQDGQQLIVAAEGALAEMNIVVGGGTDLVQPRISP